MKKLLYIFKYISFGIQLLLLFAEIVRIVTEKTFHYEPLTCFLMLSVALLVFIDLSKISNRINKKNNTKLMVLQLLLCSILIYFAGDGFLQMYAFFLLDSIFELEISKRKWMIGIHFITLVSAEILRILVLENRKVLDSIHSILYFAMVYGIILLVFLIIHYFKEEQYRLQKLNADILAYSFEERKYLIEKERSSISQEIHDTVGHSLVAILLNVRYLKAITEKSQYENITQIEEIEQLLAECVANLRSSVTNLRKLEENINLKEEIDRVIYKFNQLGFVKIELDYDNEVDNVSKEIRSAIYITIQEGITNSIRHGNATKIYIIIKSSYEQIQLIIQDNGLGCSNINKSYGLMGIEERFFKLSGKVAFTSAKNKGFTIRIVFPGRIEE